MASIYIDRRDAVLDADGGALVVRVDGERAASLPLGGTQRVVVRRAGSITHRLLATLGERGIGMLVLGGRKGEPVAHMLGAPHADAAIRGGQHALAADPRQSLALARLAARGKIGGQLALVRDALADGSGERRLLLAAEQGLVDALDRLGAAALAKFNATRR